MSRSIAIRNGRIYEYRTDRGFLGFGAPTTYQVSESADLLFPTRGRTPYYQPGDWILNATLNEREASMRFSEFADRADSGGASWGGFIMSLMDLDRVHVAKRIESISGSGESAIVTMKPLMIISPTEVLELTLRNGSPVDVQRMSQIRESFMWATIYNSTRHIIPMSQVMMEIITIPIGGAGRSAASRVMAPLVRRYSLRILRRLVSMGGSRLARRIAIVAARKSAVFSSKVAKATAVETARMYHEQLHNNQLRGRVDPATLQAIRLDDIIKRSLRKAIADEVTGEIVSGIESVVPEGTGAGFLPQTMRERITEYVTRKLLSTVLTPCTEMVRAAILAVPISGDRETYERALGQRLTERMSAFFTTDTLTGLIQGAYKDIMDAPEILVP